MNDMHGFFHTDLTGFAFEDHLSIAAWVLSGKQGSSACAISIERRDIREHLVRIGGYHSDGYLWASVRRGPQATGTADMFYQLHSKSTGEMVTREKWYHVALVRTRDKITFYVNGERCQTISAGQDNGLILKAQEVRVLESSRCSVHGLIVSFFTVSPMHLQRSLG